MKKFWEQKMGANFVEQVSISFLRLIWKKVLVDNDMFYMLVMID